MSDLDAVTVAVIPQSIESASNGETLRFTVRIENPTHKDFYGVIYECITTADNGAFIARAVGAENHLRRYSYLYGEIGFHHLKQRPHAVACRATDLIDEDVQ